MTSLNKKKIINFLKIAVEFIRKWKFRFSFTKVMGAYASVIAMLVGGWQIAVYGHVIDGEAEVDNWAVNYGGLDWPTVVIILAVTAFFLAILFYHDRDEVRKNYALECNRKSFEGIYIPYFNKLFTYLDLDKFQYWSYNICVAGDCRISDQRYNKLRELVDFCDQIQMIEGYELFHSLTMNLRLVLKDTLNVFDIHSRLIGGNTYEFHKFYKDHVYDVRNEREEFEWQEELFLISDLFFEFTCVANLLLCRIREQHPSFLSEYGILTIAEAENHKHEKAPITFREDEMSDAPYPGLKDFLSLRSTRDFHYGQGDSIKETLRKELVLR